MFFVLLTCAFFHSLLPYQDTIENQFYRPLTLSRSLEQVILPVWATRWIPARHCLPISEEKANVI